MKTVYLWVQMHRTKPFKNRLSLSSNVPSFKQCMIRKIADYGALPRLIYNSLLSCSIDYNLFYFSRHTLFKVFPNLIIQLVCVYWAAFSPLPPVYKLNGLRVRCFEHSAIKNYHLAQWSSTVPDWAIWSSAPGFESVATHLEFGILVAPNTIFCKSSYMVFEPYLLCSF